MEVLWGCLYALKLHSRVLKNYLSIPKIATIFKTNDSFSTPNSQVWRDTNKSNSLVTDVYVGPSTRVHLEFLLRTVPGVTNVKQILNFLLVRKPKV